MELVGTYKYTNSEFSIDDFNVWIKLMKDEGATICRSIPRCYKTGQSRISAYKKNIVYTKGE